MATTVGVAWWFALTYVYGGNSIEWNAVDMSQGRGVWQVFRLQGYQPTPGTSGSYPAPRRHPVAMRLQLSWRSEVPGAGQHEHIAFDVLTDEARDWVARHQRHVDAVGKAQTPKGASFTILEWDARGWPRPSMVSRSCYLRERNPAEKVLREQVEILSGWEVGRDAKKDRGSVGMKGRQIIPYEPVWGAFLFDTAFFAAAWGMLLFGRRATRWLWWLARVSKGCCGRCGYDRRGLVAGTRCPECGEHDQRSVPRTTVPTPPASAASR